MEVAREVRVTRHTVGKWRGRFQIARLRCALTFAFFTRQRLLSLVHLHQQLQS